MRKVQFSQPRYQRHARSAPCSARNKEWFAGQETEGSAAVPYVHTLWELSRARVTLLRLEPERGEITTTVIVTALMAIAAIAIIAIIVAKLTAKANSIDLGLGG
ncbi:hypothetical protein [Amycolatopsis sp. 195334CR]|uniref:hypothetical protein n=1 Tax=Amycolatopsis sp. 195334CR TaxID=2814588 RepID=UPI001A8E4BF9|nr:hypothetical protein [Amycolatopsis sp. 195334CR]MBN6034161.1 hypothetical protein [Amycolatopsis sp. 195334CR]